MPVKISVSLLFFSATVPPRRLLVVSTSSNKPLISFSDGKPTALPSIALNIFAKSVFKFSLSFAAFTTFLNSWLGNIKNPFSSTVLGLKSCTASSSEI